MNSARANKENGDWEIIKKYYVDCTTYLYLLEFLTSGSKSGTHTHTILMERDWEIRNCIVFIISSCFELGPWENNGSALASELKHSRRDSWSTHFTWNSYTHVYCSLRTIVFWLVTYSSVFAETSGAHTLLGTVIQLLNPASAHLFTDKPAGDLHWTNLRVV